MWIYHFVLQRIGYLAAAQSFHDGTDVLMLTTNMIRKVGVKNVFKLRFFYIYFNVKAVAYVVSYTSLHFVSRYFLFDTCSH